MAPAAPKRRNQRAESQLVNGAIRWLWLQGCFVWRNNTGGAKTENGYFIRFGLKGSSDLIGMTPRGRFLAVELKSAKGTLEPEQEQFRDRVVEKGGLYVLARSIDDLEAVKHELVK